MLGLQQGFVFATDIFLLSLDISFDIGMEFGVEGGIFVIFVAEQYIAHVALSVGVVAQFVLE